MIKPKTNLNRLYKREFLGLGSGDEEHLKANKSCSTLDIGMLQSACDTYMVVENKTLTVEHTEKSPYCKRIPEAVNEFKIFDGDNPGEIRVSFKKVRDADAYVVYFTEKESQPAYIHEWSSKATTTETTLLDGLKSGVRYYIKVASINPEASKQIRYNYTAVLSQITR